MNLNEFGEDTISRTSIIDYSEIDINNQMMTSFEIQQERLITDQTYWPLSGEQQSFYNVYKKDRFPYFWRENMYSGMLIDINPNTKVSRRTIYNASNWMQEVGGFSTALTGFFLVFLPLLRI